MDDNISIENWWTDLLKKYRNYMGSGYDLIEHLNKTITDCGETEKKETIDFLTQKAITEHNGSEIALAVLEYHCTPDNLELIFEKAKTFNLADQKITGYLRVIGQKGKQPHKQLLEDFLLSNQLNNNHSFVQWSTFPNFPDLFVKAYSKYLIETDYKEWTGSAIVQSFMSTPKALELLKKYLEKENKSVWRNFKNDLQTELTKDFWDKTNKTEIARIISEHNSALT
jgi:hypothetical protein